MIKPDYDMFEFKNANEWRKWLDMHHATVDGVWIRLFKKASGVESVDYAGALDHALCYGWIDGQRKSYDEVSFIQKYTPRRTKSMWSKRNIEYVARLEQAGLMTTAGQMEIERAQADGRWDAAYDKPSEMVMPEDFLKELQKHPKAMAFFETLNKTNRYSIAWRLQTAKTVITRVRRRDKIIAMLKDGQKF